MEILVAPIPSRLSSSPDVLSNASGGQLNVGIGSSIGAEFVSAGFSCTCAKYYYIKNVCFYLK